MTINNNPVPICLAVDIGGTKIASGFIDPLGKLHSEVIIKPVPCNPNKIADPNALIEIITEQSQKAQRQNIPICGLGLSICGNVSMDKGLCTLIPNLHWQNVPFGSMIAQATGLPVFAATDTRQAAMAEHFWGAARGISHFCWCTIGTGYGGYFYLDGKPFDGYHGIAGPFGHNTIDEVNGPICGCGKRGCIETYVAGPAISRAGQAAMQRGDSPLLVDLAGKDGTVTSHMVVDAYCQGDPAAVAIIDEVVRLICINLSGINNMLDLQMIILGGGIVRAVPDLVEKIDMRIRDFLMSSEAKHDLHIMKESFTNSSLFGAAAYTFMKLNLISSS